MLHGTSCSNKEHGDAVAKFNSDLQTIQALKEKLITRIGNAETIMGTVAKEDLEDQNLYSLLQTTCSEAKEYINAFPELPQIDAKEETETIKSKTDIIDSLINETQKQYNAINESINAVESSKQAKIDRVAAAEKAKRDREEAEEKKKKQEAVRPKIKRTFTQNLPDGYSVEWTLEIGQWLKATDSELIESAWSAVGGKGDVPKPEDFSVGRDNIKNNNSALAFGKISVKDTTNASGFSIKDSPVSPSARIGIRSSGKYEGTIRTMTAYSTKREYSGIYKDLSGFEIKPKMTSDKWGPVPIVLCVGGIFSPEYPEGKMDFIDISYIFGVAKGTYEVNSLGTEPFTIDAEWTND